MSTQKKSKGRENQKWRTRKEIIQAAARLLGRGRAPTLEEVAEEARVSRATIYRYFSNINLLLLEAPLDALTVEAGEILRDAPEDLAGRAAAVQGYFHALVVDHEVYFRNYLRATLEQWLNEDGRPGGPLRQARRVEAFELALAPAGDALDAGIRARLVGALSALTSIEAFVALTDVCGLSAEEARETAKWAVETLTRSAVEGTGRNDAC